jgi:hypothetical protein
MWARPYMKINFKFTFSMKDIIIYKGGTGRPPGPGPPRKIGTYSSKKIGKLNIKYAINPHPKFLGF